ncbi:hypothetical protein [Ruegeria jejuensis]|uniref:hypothetical protein n=1 Tax=Ruegeria jejuensis TaxID=3233338 RepID=UPI00355B0966
MAKSKNNGVEEPPELSRRPATALIAFASSMAMDDDVDEEVLRRLIRAVLSKKAEQAALITGLGLTNNPHTALIVSHLLAAHVAELRQQENGLLDADQVTGVWGQRLTVGAMLAAMGAAIPGTLSGGVAIALVLLAMSAGAFAAAGRLRGRAKRNQIARHREEAEALSRHLLEAIKTAPSL